MFSNDKNVETIGQLVETIKHYIGLQKEYLKLDVVDKVVRLLTAFTITLVLLGLLTIALIYLSFAVVYWIEPFVGTAGGYAVVAGFFLLVLIIVLAKRKTWIEQPLIRLLANILLN